MRGVRRSPSSRSSLAGALPLAEGTPVRFLLLGDTGHGTAQLAVADGAFQVCQQRGCDFVLIAGDNIYPHRSKQRAGPQFDSKFEVPYARFAIPFWLALGNHDNGDTFDGGRGDGSQSYKGDFEVAYSQRTDRASDKWRMPARYYTFRAGPAQFWALDTNTLMWMGDPLGQRDLLGLQQMLWLHDSMAASNARWKVVFAHHAPSLHQQRRLGRCGHEQRHPGPRHQRQAVPRAGGVRQGRPLPRRALAQSAMAGARPGLRHDAAVHQRRGQRGRHTERA